MLLAFDGGILRVFRNGFRDGRRNGRRNGWAGGGMGLRVGFINILVMYNKTVGKGGSICL